MYRLSYATDISQNYIPLSHPHYIEHTKYIQKVDTYTYDLCNDRK